MQDESRIVVIDDQELEKGLPIIGVSQIHDSVVDLLEDALNGLFILLKGLHQNNIIQVDKF